MKEADIFDELKQEWMERFEEKIMEALAADWEDVTLENFGRAKPRFVAAVEEAEFSFCGSYVEEDEFLNIDELSDFYSPREEEIEVDDSYIPPEKVRYHLIDDYYCAQEPLIRFNEYRAVLWIALKIGYPFSELVEIIKMVRNNDELYKTFFKKKSDGSKREINEPYEFLKDVQRLIGKSILTELSVNENVFGFSGGGIVKAIVPHLNSEIMLRVDCKDAFPTVDRKRVMDLLSGRKKRGKRWDKKVQGPFSWYTANVLSDLVTRNGKLPQGAPTSPRLFDLVCHRIDKKLTRLAENVGGVYTRYADNIFFSMSGVEIFPQKIKHAIIRAIEGRGPCDLSFGWHKLKISTMSNHCIRMLGLNVVEGKIHNTREFKRRIRKAIHHLNWILDQEMDHEDAWNKLKGLHSFAQKDTWSDNLRRDFEKVRRRMKKEEN